MKYPLLTYLVGSTLALSIAFNPLVGLAQDNGRGVEIKNGWLKKFAVLSRKDKDRGEKNVSAPVISGLSATSTSSKKAKIVWDTDVHANTAVWFGTTSPVNATGTPMVFHRGMITHHVVNLNKLEAGTTYYAVVRSENKQGNGTFSGVISFKTLPLREPAPPAPQPDVTAPIMGKTTLTVSRNALTLAWMTNEPSTSKVFFGTTTPVNTSTTTGTFVTDASLVTRHSLTMSGLATSTLYFMKAQSIDASGNVTTSGEFSATTLAR